MITSPPKEAVSYAADKFLFAGEYASMYDQPAIAIPMPSIEVKSVMGEFSGIRIECECYRGPINEMPEEMKGIASCIEEALKSLNQQPLGLLIRLSSLIPLGQGLVSWTAAAVAIIRSLFSLYNQGVSQKELVSLTKVAEENEYGSLSGIAESIILSEGPIWFQNKKEVSPLHIDTPLYIVIADSGRRMDNQRVINRRQRLETEQMKESLIRIGRMVHMMKQALIEGETYLLGKLLDANHAELKALGFSDDRLNQLVEAARDSGALGAKIAGAGKGGMVIALASSLRHAEVIANVLKEAGAIKAWYFQLNYSPLNS